MTSLAKQKRHEVLWLRTYQSRVAQHVYYIRARWRQDLKVIQTPEQGDDLARGL